MKTKILLLTGLGFAALLAGCGTSGLSRHEVAGGSYPNYILNLPTTNSAPDRPPLRKPIRLAVAQVGESAPPRALLNKLESNRDSIASVVGLPAPAETEHRYYAPKDNSQNKQVDFVSRVQQLCRLSKSMHADYLFICGGDMTWWNSPNLLRVFDITIVGGMVLPSTKVNVEGRAAGALVDAATCEPVLMLSTDATRSGFSPTFYIDEKTDGQRVALRDELTASLADELLKKIASQGK
jgi:hypothetical protein